MSKNCLWNRAVSKSAKKQTAFPRTGSNLTLGGPRQTGKTCRKRQRPRTQASASWAGHRPARPPQSDSSHRGGSPPARRRHRVKPADFATWVGTTVCLQTERWRPGSGSLTAAKAEPPRNGLQGLAPPAYPLAGSSGRLASDRKRARPQGSGIRFDRWACGWLRSAQEKDS